MKNFEQRVQLLKEKIQYEIDHNDFDEKLSYIYVEPSKCDFYPYFQCPLEGYEEFIIHNPFMDECGMIDFDVKGAIEYYGLNETMLKPFFEYYKC